MAFDIPYDTVLPAQNCTIGLAPGPHPFEVENRDAIRANWLRELEARPALFDGRVVLLSSLSWQAGALDAVCHAIRFSTFLHWRRLKPVPGAHHIFAHAMPVTSDGALLAVRMGAHTANAGHVYFASGSLEPYEFPGGRADILGNMAREVAEETGIDLTRLPREAGHHVLARGEGIVLVRRFQLSEDAETVARRVAAHNAAEEQPELEGPVIIRRAQPKIDGLAPHMPALIDWHFANPPRW